MLHTIHCCIKHPLGWVGAIILTVIFVVAALASVVILPFIIIYGIIMWIYETAHDGIHSVAHKIADSIISDDMLVFDEDETFDTYIEH